MAQTRRSTTLPKPLMVVPDRPPQDLSPEDAARIAAIFKALANDTRLRLLHALVVAGELCVTDLADQLGMKPQAISNQIQRLALARIVRARRDGVNVHYRIVDTCVEVLVRLGLCLAESAGAPCPPARRRAGQ